MEHVTFQSEFGVLQNRDKHCLSFVQASLQMNQNRLCANKLARNGLIFFWNWDQEPLPRTMAAAPWRLLLHQGLGVVKAVKTPFNYFRVLTKLVLTVYICFSMFLWMDESSSCSPLCFTDITSEVSQNVFFKRHFFISPRTT